MGAVQTCLGKRLKSLIPHVCFFSVTLVILILIYTRDWRTEDENIYSRVPQRAITPLYPYFIEENEKCKEGAPFLVLLIPSAPQEFHTRNVLRNTWANESLVNGVHIIRLFLLGRSKSNDEKVIQESDQFHDIIMQDFLDSYYNLTIKTLMGIEWVSRLCPKVKYIMKIDSDMFFNPWLLVERILHPQRPPKKNFFTGMITLNGLPHREKDSKWYMSTKTYSKMFYPPFCTGTGYVFSGDMAKKIYLAATSMQMFPFEDVFVGMCLEKLGVKIFELSENWFRRDRVPYDRCKFTRLVTMHHFTPEELLKIWPDFSVAVKTCNKNGLDNETKHWASVVFPPPF
ncbi:beta-1,3-galactosyltransferase 2-like [Anomaloglossus baeobatrachus]|uniref:beta-1,3-galactosyltransferase 2-like n=1 Tax=Anomaloglossus baeobatrachus TaxID=238106 RepID=UPI003F5066E9